MSGSIGMLEQLNRFIGQNRQPEPTPIPRGMQAFSNSPGAGLSAFSGARRMHDIFGGMPRPQAGLPVEEEEEEIDYNERYGSLLGPFERLIAEGKARVGK